jgi:hypothetical protein
MPWHVWSAIFLMINVYAPKYNREVSSMFFNHRTQRVLTIFSIVFMILLTTQSFSYAAKKNKKKGLDMVALTTLGRIIYEENIRTMYGTSTEVLGAGFRQLEKDIWQIAAKVLTKEQQVELRQLILIWRKNNPDKVVYNYLRFSDFAGQRRNSTLVKKVQAGGLFKTVQEVTQ